MKNFAPRVEILGIAETSKVVLINTAMRANTAMEIAFVNMIPSSQSPPERMWADSTSELKLWTNERGPNYFQKVQDERKKR